VGQQRPAKTEIDNDPFVHASYVQHRPFVDQYKPALRSRQPITNRFDAAQRDYLLTYLVGADPFVFYQTPDKTFIRSFTCSTPRVAFAHGVRVGMSQAAFERVFHRTIASTVATVEDTEGFELYTFTFRQHALARIDFECQMD
jgi:hypothetical protein